MKWKTVRNFRPNGHAYFEDEIGRLAIADCSGSYPEDTDDGVLYLQEPLMITERSSGENADSDFTGPSRSTIVLHLKKFVVGRDDITHIIKTTTPISFEEASFLLKLNKLGDCPLCGSDRR